MIEKLKAAYEAATPGEWDADRDGCVYSGKDTMIVGDYSRSHSRAREDATFIALAHNTMPALLEAVELLTDVSRELEETDKEYWATALYRRIETLKTKLQGAE